MANKILLVGLGHLGGVILELLAREAAVDAIVVASRNPERGIARCNLARVGALAQGQDVSIRFAQIDLEQRAVVEELIRQEDPTLILSTASLLTWWLPELMSPEVAAPLMRAGFGAWLPVHLAPTLKLMEAVRAAGYQGHTLTAPYPDVVNRVLQRIELAPSCGVGNIGEMAPKVQSLAADRLKAPAGSVHVTLVAHHALFRSVFAGAADQIPPFFLRVHHDGRDVTAEIDAEKLLLQPFPLPPGRVTHFLTAGATLHLVRALLSQGEVRVHAPAPGGLPGGYPVLAGADGVRPAPIDGLTLEAAISINERSQPFDGIERIEADGTVVFTGETATALRDTLGYECQRLKPEDALARAGELLDRLTEYGGKHGHNIGISRDR